MPQLTDVVKHLLIINVILFFLVTSAAGSFMPDLALYFPGDSRFKPYQLISHMFMHADTGHLFFNMFGLFIFGPYVERYVGKQKFFILYLLSGIGAFVAHFGVEYYMAAGGSHGMAGVVGASGALMGIVLAFATLFPNLRMMLIFPPIPVKAKYLALFYVGLDLYSGFSGAQNNVANFAHLGGALTGFLLTYFWLKGSRPLR